MDADRILTHGLLNLAESLGFRLASTKLLALVIIDRPAAAVVILQCEPPKHGLFRSLFAIRESETYDGVPSLHGEELCANHCQDRMTARLRRSRIGDKPG